MQMRVFFTCFFLLAIFSVKSQLIGEFVSLPPSTQDQSLKLPCTHTFQLLVKQGTILSTGSALPGFADFTGYFELSPGVGKLTINHELTTAALSLHNIYFNSGTKLWSLGTSQLVNFTPVVKATHLCSGGMSPWKTLFSCEENAAAGDVNADGYQDVGWIIETDPVTGNLKDYGSDGTKDKCWALGRTVHENICFVPDSLTAYYGADITTNGFLYKFVANQKADFSSGTLYVLKKTTVLDSIGTWVVVPNSTQAERNGTQAYAVSVGATNFNRIEDVEFGPDGKVYFTATTSGNIYRLKDNGAGINHFEIYVKNQVYTVNTASGPAAISWGSGIDNLCFDPQGNLWAFKDGAGEYMWYVDKTHSMALPNISIFGQMPAGAEPTGINFSPDGKFMFMSVQHPTASNTLVNTDAAGIGVVFNKSATIVIARREFLGSSLTNSILNLNNAYCIDAPPVVLSASTFSGTFTGTGISNDTLYPAIADTGSHVATLQYADASGCIFYANDTFQVNPLPVVSLTYDSTLCYYDTNTIVNANVAGVLFSGLTDDSLAYFNPYSEGSGLHYFQMSYTDNNGCSIFDTFSIHVYNPTHPVLIGLDTAYCNNALADTLFFTPTLAVLTASQGLSANVFIPATTTASTVSFLLVFTDSLGCTYDTNAVATILVPGSNLVTGFGSVMCSSTDTVPLNLMPSGGILSGSGIAGSGIQTSQALLGANSFTYTTTDINNCNYTSVWSYFVISPAPVSAGNDDTTCFQAGVYHLNGFPGGGYWMGNYVDSAGMIDLDSLSVGNYQYIYFYTDVNGCDNNDTVVLNIQNCTDIMSSQEITSVLVYPNPGNGCVTISRNKISSKINIVNSQGQKIEFNVLHENNNATEIQLNEKSGGVYFIKVGNKIIKYVMLK
jgi:streptogramin lyase